MGLAVIIVGIFALCLGFIGFVWRMAFRVMDQEASEDTYDLGAETLKSVKDVVGKRKVKSFCTETCDGLTTKTMDYVSDTVEKDLDIYLRYLTGEGGFRLFDPVDLSQTPGTIQMGKHAKEAGEIMMVTIDYDQQGYSVVVQKGAGTLTFYD